MTTSADGIEKKCFLHMVRIQKQDSADHLFLSHLDFFLCNLKKEYLLSFWSGEKVLYKIPAELVCLLLHTCWTRVRVECGNSLLLSNQTSALRGTQEGTQGKPFLRALFFTMVNLLTKT